MGKRLNQKVLLIVAPIIFLLVSLPELYIDVVNPDGINWHTRSYSFTKALIKKDYPNTFQTYHPGVTLMWISGPFLYKHANHILKEGYQPFSKETFLDFDYIGKLSVVIASTLLFLISLLFLKNIANKQFLLLFSVLSTFEPFVLGQRRLYHLDFLTSHLVFVSFLAFYYYFFKSSKLRHLILGCLFFSLGLLTKSTAIIFLPFPFIMNLFSKSSIKRKLLTIPTVILFSLVFIYLFFPALWKNPKQSALEIYQKIKEGMIDIGYYNKKEIGFSGDKENITLERSEESFDWYFYPLSMLYRLSPVALVLLIASVFYWRHTKRSPLSLFAFLIIATFFVAFTIASKKCERYGIIFFPFLFLIISEGLSRLKYKTTGIVSLILVLSLIPQCLQIFPYFYAYTDPIFGGVKAKYKILDSEPFGVATYKVFETIKMDRKGSTEPYTISANKSLRTITAGASPKRAPNCEANYYVRFATEPDPFKMCDVIYDLIKVVKVGNMDYWFIYKNPFPAPME